MSDNVPARQENGYVLAKFDDIVRRKYLRDLSSLRIKPLPATLKDRTPGKSACFLPVKKIVYDRNENNFQRMMNVCIGAASIDASIAIIIHHPEKGKDAEIYIGVCDENNPQDAQAKTKIFFNNLIGNFPGLQTGRKVETPFLSQKEIDHLVSECLNPDKYHSISCISGVASLRAGSKQDNPAFLQGIEKLIDGMEDRVYSVIIIANSISHEMIADMQAEHENLYHMLSPHAKVAISMNHSTSESISKTVSEASSDVLSTTKSTTLSIGKSRSDSDTVGGNNGISDTVGLHGGINAGANGGVNLGIVNFGGSTGVYGGGSYSHSWSRSENWGKTTTIGNTDTISSGDAVTNGTTTTISSSDGKTVTVTTGNSHQLTFENKTVLELMTIIDSKIKRLHAGMEQGMFAVSAYFVSSNIQGAKSAASIYKSLITGDNSHIESSVINEWDNIRNNDLDNESNEYNILKYNTLKEYLIRLCHPVFHLYENADVTPASVVTAGELAIHMMLPGKSITGIPVSYTASFGRSIHHVSSTSNGNDNEIKLGKLYHLGTEEETEVSLDLRSLSMHTLLCGTTGSGKSNASYLILQNLLKHQVNFLIIEPAKGEYKDILSDNVSVYGTNPYLSDMLRINPFRFCQAGKSVHILEHLDRLASIFNVCWPMEAAMPAVLKNALERAYVAAGWDLQRSINLSSPLILPTFEDVMHEVENFMEFSSYSDENKGNYIGALCTRLKDLTTGINGMIFCSDDLSDSDIFDKNVIVDLSRVGNPETKALIMGMLLIRLQEYRQCTVKYGNSKLHHITVLEEAHNLLRNTASPQVVDGANLAGRSVEMLSNAFAEMRTYGEGFFIIDQSPAQLDKSVIRNTNTKILMRLPEYEDRRLVGKAVGLNEDQISELAKLPTGVAVVYQNDWLESVLAKVFLAKLPNSKFEYNFDDEKMFNKQCETTLKDVLASALISNFETWLGELGDNSILKVSELAIPTACKKEIIEYALNFTETSEIFERKVAFARIVYEFFNAQTSFSKAILSECTGVDDAKKLILENLDPQPEYFDEQAELLKLLVVEHTRRNPRNPTWEKMIEVLACEDVIY